MIYNHYDEYPFYPADQHDLHKRIKLLGKEVEALRHQKQRDESYFSSICEALDIHHDSDLMSILLAIDDLTENRGV